MFGASLVKVIGGKSVAPKPMMTLICLNVRLNGRSPTDRPMATGIRLNIRQVGEVQHDNA